MALLDGIFGPVVQTVLNTIGPGASITQRTQLYDSASDKTIEGTKVYPVTVGIPIDYSAKDVDGDSVQTGDFQLVLAAEGLAFTPDKSNCTITLADGRVAQIVSIETITAGILPVAYNLQCRF